MANEGVTVSLFDHLLNKVKEAGIEKAVKFEVETSEGVTFTISRQDDPRLQEQVNPEEVKVKILQSAGAGGRE